MRSSIRRAVFVLLVTGLTLSVVAPSACAQQWGGVGRFDVMKVLRAGTADASSRATLDRYFKGYLDQFAKGGNGDQLPDLRRLYRDIVRGTGKNPAHDYLNDRMFRGMIDILRKENPVATKYNVMLFLADLNESDDPVDIKPLPAVLVMLVRTYQRADKMPELDYVRPAALIGIQRFAEEGGITPAQAAAITAELLKLVNDPDPPAGRSASAHSFLRASAARALAAMRSPGPNNSVAKAFEAIAADPAARVSLRCEVVQLMGQLRYPPGANADLTRMANVIGHVAVELCQQEINRAEANKGELSRRMLLYVASSCRNGLVGLYGSASDAATKASIGALGRKFSDLCKTLDDSDKSDDEVAEAVTTQIAAIEEMLPPKPEPPATEPVAATR